MKMEKNEQRKLNEHNHNSHTSATDNFLLLLLLQKLETHEFNRQFQLKFMRLGVCVSIILQQKEHIFLHLRFIMAILDDKFTGKCLYPIFILWVQREHTHKKKLLAENTS